MPVTPKPTRRRRQRQAEPLRPVASAMDNDRWHPRQPDIRRIQRAEQSGSSQRLVVEVIDVGSEERFGRAFFIEGAALPCRKDAPARRAKPGSFPRSPTIY
jgi:hypothetical protein